MLKSQLFDRIRSQKGDKFLKEKIIPISGDVERDELGISNLDFVKIIQNVSIVFHSAATVRFDEHLKSAIEINIRGTRKILELCNQMMFLEVIKSEILMKIIEY